MIRLHVSEMTAGLQVTLKNSNYNTYCTLPLCEKTALNHILEMQVCTLLHNFYSLPKSPFLFSNTHTHHDIFLTISLQVIKLYV